MTKTALIIGATGGVGGALARNLLRRGWRVRALTRSRARAMQDCAELGAVEWIEGDAMNEADVVSAAAGAKIIFHGAHPPGYRDWRKVCLPMLENTIAAARRSGARIVFPGTIYNFGPDAGLLLSETSPQRPLTRKGAIRVEMERMLEAVSAWGIRSLIVRAADYLGPNAKSSWFNAAMIRPGKRPSYVLYPGDPSVGHGFAYLPDLAEAMARLIEIEDRLEAFDVFHFAGHFLPKGGDIAHSVARAVGRDRLPLVRLPVTLVRLAAIFNQTFYEMLEIRYLWREPTQLDNRKLVAAIGPEPRTPFDTAIAETLAALGCLADQAPGGDGIKRVGTDHPGAKFAAKQS